VYIYTYIYTLAIDLVQMGTSTREKLIQSY